VAISVAQARLICTKAELDLVLQSTNQAIGTLDAKQLQASVRRARTLRDKWRDLSNDQTRTTKASDPEKLDAANARSAEKVQLFSEVLERFEKRLAKAEPVAAATRTKATPKARAAEHRHTRSQVRGDLTAKVDELNTPKPAPAAKKPVTKKAAPAPAAPATPVASAPAAPTKKKAKAPAAAAKTAKPTKGKKASGIKPPKRKPVPKPQISLKAPAAVPTADGMAAAAIAAGHSIAGHSTKNVDEKRRNLKATTAAKASRIQISGAHQLHGHMAAQSRRSQAKRSGGAGGK
jgi:hypothetical protein